MSFGEESFLQDLFCTCLCETADAHERTEERVLGISGEKRCSMDPLWFWQRVPHVHNIVNFSSLQSSAEVCLTCTMLCVDLSVGNIPLI